MILLTFVKTENYSPNYFFWEDFVRIAYDVYLQYLYVGRLYMY